MPGGGLGDPSKPSFKFDERLGLPAPQGGNAKCESNVNECHRTLFVNANKEGSSYCDQFGGSLTKEWIEENAVVHITSTDVSKHVVAYVEAGAIKCLRNNSNRDSRPKQMNQLDWILVAGGNVQSSHSVAVLAVCVLFLF